MSAMDVWLLNHYGKAYHIAYLVMKHICEQFFDGHAGLATESPAK